MISAPSDARETDSALRSFHSLSTVLPVLCDFLSLPFKLLQLTRICRSFPTLSAACFRRDALLVAGDEAGLALLQAMATRPALRALLSHCKTALVDSDLLRTCVDAAQPISASRAGSLLSTPSFSALPIPLFSPSVFPSLREMVISVTPPFGPSPAAPQSPAGSAVSGVLSLLLSSAPLLSALTLDTRRLPYNAYSNRSGAVVTAADLGAISSLPALRSLTMSAMCLTADAMDLIVGLPLAYLDLHDSWVEPAQPPSAPSPARTSCSPGCTTLLPPGVTRGSGQRNLAWTLSLLRRLCGGSSRAASGSHSLVSGLPADPASSLSGSGCLRIWLTLNFEQRVPDLSLGEVWDACPQLVTLDVYHGLPEEAHMEALFRSLCYPDSLSPHLPNLRHLAMDEQHYLGFRPPMQVGSMLEFRRFLVSYGSQLLSLDIARCCRWPRDKDRKVLKLLLTCSQLQSLAIVSHARFQGRTGAPRLPHLHFLSLTVDGERTAKRLPSLLAECPHLTSLALSQAKCDVLALLHWLRSLCPRITTMQAVDSGSDKWHRYKGTGSEGLTALSPSAPHRLSSLTSLDWTIARFGEYRYPLLIDGLTCAAIAASLVMDAPRLRFLRLDCTTISSDTFHPAFG